jgi:hypothetical protein
VSSLWDDVLADVLPVGLDLSQTLKKGIACSRPGWAVPHNPWIDPWRGRVSGAVSTMRA